MLCYKHCTSFLKRLCFKISMFQENMRDKTFEYSSLFLSRRRDQFFQQVSLKGSEIICNFKKVMKTTIKKMADVAKHRCNVQQNGKPTNSKGIFFFFKFMFFLNLILNCLLSWMFKELFIFFYLNLLMQHILCHRTCLDLHSFALPNISCCVSNTKEWRILSGSATRSPGQLLIWAANPWRNFQF